MRLNGKVAVITGGANGTGAAAARTFVDEGAFVAIVDRDHQAGERVAAELNRNRDAALFIAADVTDEESVAAATAVIRDRWDRIDVLYNNAGIMDLENDGPVDVCSVAAWQRVIAVNVTGVFLVSKHVVPVMREGSGGSIINTSSAVALAGASRYAAYVASKGAIASLTRSMAAMHGRHRIRVNAICPGILETALTKEFLEKEEDRQRAIQWHILRRLGSPEDVVGLVVYLASDESSWMTGAVIPIDGGATAK